MKTLSNFLFCFIILSIFTACNAPKDLAEQRKYMVEKQILWRGIKDQKVLDAMLTTPREEFVLPQYRDKAYADLEVPTGEGQTLDRPYEDAFILQVLDLKQDDKILEIGTGSGYLTALISRIAKEIYTIDIIPALIDNATKRFHKLNYSNIKTKAGDGFLGWPEFAPFDAIVLTCSPSEVPKPLIPQLKEGGKILLPVGGKERFQELLLYTKKNGKLEKPKILAGTTFVPMEGKALE